MSTQDLPSLSSSYSLHVLSTSFSFSCKNQRGKKYSYYFSNLQWKHTCKSRIELSFGSNNQTKSVHVCARIRRRFQNGVSLDSRPQRHGFVVSSSVTAGEKTSPCTSQTQSWNSFFKYHKHASAQHQSQLFSVKTSALLDLPGIENSIIFNWQHKIKQKSMREKTQASILCLISWKRLLIVSLLTRARPRHSPLWC